jgi:F-type H+-transporting ATPase subunit a
MPFGFIAGGEHGSESLGDLIIHHVTDGPPLLDLRLGMLDLSITKHVLMLWTSAMIVLVLFLWYSSHLRKAPDGVPTGRLANMVDFFVEYIHKEMVLPLIGPEHGARWTPLIAAFFFFILTCNLLGLTPIFDWLEGSTTATGNFNVTAGLAMITFFSIILAGSIVHGFIGHWRNLVPKGVPVAVLPILIPIEVLGMFVKPFALTMRLAANMTAGHIAIISIFSIIFLLETWLVAFFAVPLALGLMLLEIIVAFVQAYVFTLLSTVFIGMAVNVHH